MSKTLFKEQAVDSCPDGWLLSTRLDNDDILLPRS